MGDQLERQSENHIWNTIQIKHLGVGVFNQVFIGYCKGADRTVAVKHIRQEEQASLQGELSLVVELHSHFIVEHTLEHIEGLRDEMALIMELPERTLGDELKMTKNYFGLPHGAVITIIDNTREALLYLHSKMIFHGDIKPDSIFMFSASSWTFKLGNFGAARQLQRPDELMNQMPGTPAYTNPEIRRDIRDNQYRGHGYTKDAQDIWGTACTFFECITGRLLRVEDNGTITTYRVHGTTEHDAAPWLDQMPLDACFSSRQLQLEDIHQQFFQLLFNQNNGFLQLTQFCDLCKEFTSLKCYKYWNISALCVDEYFDTTNSKFFRRTGFHQGMIESLQRLSNAGLDGPNNGIKIMEKFNVCAAPAGFQPSDSNYLHSLVAWYGRSGEQRSIEVFVPTLLFPSEPALKLATIQPTDEAQNAIKKAVARVLQMEMEEAKLRNFLNDVFNFSSGCLTAVQHRCSRNPTNLRRLREMLQQASTVLPNTNFPIVMQLPEDANKGYLSILRGRLQMYLHDQRKPRIHELQEAQEQAAVADAGTEFFKAICNRVEREYDEVRRSQASTTDIIADIVRGILGPDIALMHDALDEFKSMGH